MQVLVTKADMKKWSIEKKKSKTICLVPTMGYFHQGHISLMKKGKTLADELVVSIFVNPTQFGHNEDLDHYPSDIKKDLVLAKKIGASAVFLPDKKDIYEKNFQTQITLEPLSLYLCGKSRPSHFQGVATIVTKLFNIIAPDIAVFGQKDFQQLQIIKQLVKDLDFNIKIVSGRIIREKDGLAMSSRNSYLSNQQRKIALNLFKSLNLVKNSIKKGEKNIGVIKAMLEDFFKPYKELQIEYLCFCNTETLVEVDILDSQVLFAVAAKIGTTRLIDNLIIG